jgi:predicted RNA-binding Zn-ribbon protein involved in translation (DUF1610 family)
MNYRIGSWHKRYFCLSTNCGKSSPHVSATYHPCPRCGNQYQWSIGRVAALFWLGWFTFKYLTKREASAPKK